jgi:hypothetical protein
LLISLTLKTNVYVLDLHHDILLNFRKFIKLLSALLSGDTPDVSQKIDRVRRIYASGVGKIAMADLLLLEIVDFVLDKKLIFEKRIIGDVGKMIALGWYFADVL